MEDQVLEALKAADRPLRPGEIAKILGLESIDVSAAIANLKRDGKVESPKRCFYAPAE